ncbi:MAG: ABC transporter permease [Lachnospiraceae bacterium]|nr:ABC transporter permease [Lachnospiraceae bacterium]
MWYLIKNNLKLMLRNKIIFVLMVFGPFFVIGILSSAFEEMMKSYETAEDFRAGYQIEKGSFWESSIEAVKEAGEEAGIKLSEYPEGEPEELVKNNILAGFVKLGTDKYTIYENTDNETEGVVLEYFFSQYLNKISSQVLYAEVPVMEGKTLKVPDEGLKVPMEEIDYMPAINSKDYYGITEIIYFSCMGIICMAGVLASEKKNGIGIKFQITSVTDFQFYIAKWLPTVFVVASGIGISSVLSAVVYGIHWGNLFISMLLVFLVIMAGVSYGLMLYTVSGNMAVTVIVLFSSVFFMAFLGGCFETYMYSGFSEDLKNISPVYHVNRALVENSCMGHSGYTLNSILYLLAISAACTCAALLAGWAGKRGKKRG